MGIQKILRKKKRLLLAKKKYEIDKEKYKEFLNGTQFELREENNIPILFDIDKEAGNIDPHYFLQDIYMAQKVISCGIKNHYDIGSRVDGFIAHLLSSGQFDSITMLDIRPLSLDYFGLEFIQTDATNLDSIADNSIFSLSSLHAIEHFGLGRYGDEIDPDAWKKALKAIEKKLAPQGVFFLSVPIGIEEKLCFNAHRIFSPQTIVNTLSECELCTFAYIHSMKIIESTINDFMLNGGRYDCGMFVFRKR